MKGVVLAGGTGSRLRPLTHTTQKQLIPVANKPVLEYVIEDMRDAGITDIGVILGDSFPEQIKSHLGTGEEFGVDLTYIIQGRPLGLAHAVGCAQDYVGEESFLVYFGDTIISNNITSTIVEEFDPDEYVAGLGLQHVQQPSRFGIVDIGDDGEITEILEKPDDPPTNLAYIGEIAFTPDIFEVIEELEPSWRGELELTDALHRLVAGKHSIQWQIKEGMWRDVGTPTDVIQTNEDLLEDLESDIPRGDITSDSAIEGPVRVGSNCTVGEGVTIEGPVIIGPNTTIHGNAYIGPYTSLGSGVEIRNVRIDSSVILDDVEITGGRPISDSIIGRESTITSELEYSDHSDESADQFILADNSIINR